MSPGPRSGNHGITQDGVVVLCGVVGGRGVVGVVVVFVVWHRPIIVVYDDMMD